VIVIEPSKKYRFALLHLGFRLFFLLGAVFSAFAISAWFWFYYHGTQFLDNGNFPIILWHAHEMIFGYSMAVAVGFLLTAVKNWTGHQTLRGYRLLLLGLFWLMARIMPFTDFPGALMIMALFDLLFDVTVCIALLYPLVRSKQWKQLGIWSILLLMTTGNTLFYIGLIWKHPELTQIGLFFGLYLIIALIMLMGQRIMPFFIERGVGYPVVLRVRPWVNISSLILMMFFIVAVVWNPISLITVLVAIALAFLQVLQMIGWYTPGIWRKPLLWSLYLAYGWIFIGFILTALAHWIPINPMLGIHAFAYGGVGMMTIGMMARVSLGHTGRNIFTPPSALNWIFFSLLLGAIVRVIIPIILPMQYRMWIEVSQGLWIIAFVGFIIVYAPMLIKPRIDGRYG
jgi:uncharacterized protein involved in response to NO